MGSQFGQDVEPAGKYVSMGYGFVPEGNQEGTVTFNNPLVIDITGQEYPQWKNDLSKLNSGATKEALSNNLREQGYDAIITVEEYKGKYSPSETILLDDASDSNKGLRNVRFRILGEKGADALDKFDESFARMNNLSIARKMESDDKSEIDIKLATGWEKGVDKKWRYEIDDPTNLALDTEELTKLGLDYSAQLNEVIDHPELFIAYPFLKDIAVQFDEMDNGIVGSFGSGIITLKHDETSIKDEKNNQLIQRIGNILRKIPIVKNKVVSPFSISGGIYATLSHEIQHAIQEYEGFAPGGAAEGQMPFRGLTQFQIYESLGGEVESRNTETRLEMTSEKRRTTL